MYVARGSERFDIHPRLFLGWVFNVKMRGFLLAASEIFVILSLVLHKLRGNFSCYHQAYRGLLRCLTDKGCKFSPASLREAELSR